MKTLARAIVDTLAVLRLSKYSEDSPEQVMELIAEHLQGASPEERQALVDVVREQYRFHNEASAPEEVIDFYESFDEVFLGEDDDA